MLNYFFTTKYQIIFVQVSKNVSEEITLQTVDEDVVKAGNALKDIADDPGRQQCLEAFCACMELVEWLHNVTKSRH